jgi:hypothetical protein
MVADAHRRRLRKLWLLPLAALDMVAVAVLAAECVWEMRLIDFRDLPFDLNQQLQQQKAAMMAYKLHSRFNITHPLKYLFSTMN